MTIAITDLLRDLTKEEVLEDLLEIAQALGLTTTAWQPGEPIHTLLALISEQIAAFWNNPIARALRAAFLDYAEGDWLTLIAWVVYDVHRHGETFATMSLVVENRAGGFYTFQPGDLRVTNSAGKGFTSTSSGTLNPWPGSGDYPTVTITFEADEAGSGSDTDASDIPAYPTTPASAPAGVYVRTNSLPAFGQDEETDDSVKNRCRLSTGPLSPTGPKSAYESVALATLRDDGTAVNVTRVRVLEPGNCVVTVLLANDGGAAGGDTLTEGTDVYLVNAQIQDLVVPAGITCNVLAATNKAIAYTVALFVDRKSHLTAAEAKSAAETALANWTKALYIGGNRVTPGGQGYVFKSEIEAVASESARGIITATCLGSDTALDDDEVAVITFTVSATVVTQ